MRRKAFAELAFFEVGYRVFAKWDVLCEEIVEVIGDEAVVDSASVA